MLEKSLYAREKLQTLNLWNDTIFTTRLQDSRNILQFSELQDVVALTNHYYIHAAAYITKCVAHLNYKNAAIPISKCDGRLFRNFQPASLLLW